MSDKLKGNSATPLSHDCRCQDYKDTFSLGQKSVLTDYLYPIAGVSNLIHKVLVWVQDFSSPRHGFCFVGMKNLHPQLPYWTPPSYDEAFLRPWE